MTGGRPHHPVDADRVFVDGLLTEAQALLGDPRIRVVHVRHTGPPASDTRPSSESDATSLAPGRALTARSHRSRSLPGLILSLQRVVNAAAT